MPASAPWSSKEGFDRYPASSKQGAKLANRRQIVESVAPEPLHSPLCFGGWSEPNSSQPTRVGQHDTAAVLRVDAELEETRASGLVVERSVSVPVESRSPLADRADPSAHAQVAVDGGSGAVERQPEEFAVPAHLTHRVTKQGSFELLRSYPRKEDAVADHFDPRDALALKRAPHHSANRLDLRKLGHGLAL